MAKNLKTYFQDIHYLRKKPNFILNSVLGICEFFYATVINFKNFLYEKNILKEKNIPIPIICVGNLTTGGVGKTPIVIEIANKISKEKKVAIISRGYKSKLSGKTPVIVKDFKGLNFDNGLLCGDEPYQLAKKVNDNVVVITCTDRYIASQEAIIKFAVDIIILDDGFSNRKLKKDKSILVIDSKMRFGNNRLLPKGPLREPLSQFKRANEIILVNKGDNNLDNAIKWAKEFNLPLKICTMKPDIIYSATTKAKIKPNLSEKPEAIAFCAIGQPEQFYSFLEDKYVLVDKISFDDHHLYTKDDIKALIKIAKEKDVRTFITTQKDETKLLSLIEDIKGYSFNVLKLKNVIEEIK